ncbi:AAA family ATPase [Halomicrococcus sp. NG-SE-24]|uniref:AAA family ATPase n=1 Tax=Halomicrococcus sp. NG-SE-24 TaxID=3436928 RepID=UPI003D96FFC5
MLITKITLENFGPYYGTVEVNPRPESAKPIILFRGENDTGKTSLYKSIRYCLHGAESRAQRNSFINRDAAVEGDGTARIQLDFQHQGTTYILERVIEFNQVTDEADRAAVDWSRSVKTPDETIIAPDDSGDEYNTFINNIIPESAADYFFFDAEELQRFEEGNDAEIRDAIETVLGIREIENAISDLDNREREYERELTQIESTVKEVNEKRQELQEVIAELNDLTGDADSKGDIGEIEDEIEDTRALLTEVQENLAKAKDADEYRKELTEVRDELEMERDKLKSKKEKRDEIRKLAGPLAATRGANVVSEEFQAEGVKGEVSVISRVLEDGECICGEEFDTRDRHMDHLRDRLTTLTSPENQEMSELNAFADEFTLEVSERIDRFQELQTDIRSISSRIESLEDREEKLESEINEIEREFSEELKNREDQLEREIQELKDKQARKRERVGELRNQRGQLRQRIDSQEGASDREERLQNLTNIAGKSRQAFESLKDEFVESRRKEVEKHTSETFLKLTNRPDYYDGLCITEDYELKLLVDGNKRDIADQMPSAGQRQIIAYAFIAGLSRYTTRDAPVIIDTPIGRLDPTHKQNLIDHYHEFSNQVLILYQPNELSEEDLDEMQDRVAEHYEIRIRDDMDSASEIVPQALEPLLIGGK